MLSDRPIILSIAGLDPTGGAGILADIKTFESNKCQGMSVCTAVTDQVEDQVIDVRWESLDSILSQLKPLLERYSFSAVKIGILPSISYLTQIVEVVRTKKADTIIIWDPVVNSSSGFNLLESTEGSNLSSVLDNIDLITPNLPEFSKVAQGKDLTEKIEWATNHCDVYLTGGHNDTDPGRDRFFSKEKNWELKGSSIRGAKHGSGCVLSSALAANLALGHSMHKSGLRAKRYVERFLNSNNTLLGHHRI